MERFTQQVTIIDRTHPFFGRTFPVVSLSSPRGKTHLILLLANGQHRIVPHAATDLGQTQKQNSEPQLPRISVRTMLPLARLIQSKLQAREVWSDVSETSGKQAKQAPNPSSTPKHNPRPAQSMAPDDAASTTTVGPLSGPIDPTHSLPGQGEAGGAS